MRKSIKKKNKRKVIWWARVIFCAVAVFLLFVAIDMAIRPIIREYAAAQAREVGVYALNDAVLIEMKKNPQLFENLITVQYAENGDVKGIITDTVKLNAINAALTQSANIRLQEISNQKITVPLGTLIDWQLVSGRGPKITFRVVPVNYAESKIVSKFEQAGINQTQYRLLLQFNARVMAVIPGYVSSTDIENEVSIAETVIIGNVPDTFLNMQTQ
ncbi:MAG: sporulation protein YunB [Oscillospiraceae bacterium]|nr:sporulation protein YunB [Oscillospiraceae bacterium]